MVAKIHIGDPNHPVEAIRFHPERGDDAVMWNDRDLLSAGQLAPEFMGGATTTPLRTTGGRLAVPVDALDHTLGPEDAPVTLVEYGDYQCPYCGMVHPIVRDLLRRREGKIRFVYRHFPLTNVHQYAEMAAEVAEAAEVRGRYWPVHDWLYDNQFQLDPAFLAVGLDSLDLDGAAIAEEIRIHPYLERVRTDFIGGLYSGVSGTPAFFINGLRHDGGYTMAELETAVDAALDPHP